MVLTDKPSPLLTTPIKKSPGDISTLHIIAGHRLRPAFMAVIYNALRIFTVSAISISSSEKTSSLF